MSHFRPFVVTYPFEHENGQELLVVIGHYKFPISKDFPIREIPSPKSFKERWLNAWGKYPGYYYFERETFEKLQQNGPGAAEKLDPTLPKIFKARVAFVPFLLSPRLKNEDYIPARAEIASVHRENLKAVIEVMHQLGFHSAMSEHFKDLQRRMQLSPAVWGDDPPAVDGQPPSTVQRLIFKAEEEIHKGSYGRHFRLMQQYLYIRGPFQLTGKEIIWVQERTFRNPTRYRLDEFIREHLDESLKNAWEISKWRSELREKGHSEEEIDHIVYPDPAERQRFQEIRAQLQKSGYKFSFTVDDP